MPKQRMPTAISAEAARKSIGSVLRRVAQRKAGVVITKEGKPTAVLLDVRDFDDMLEKLDPEATPW